MPKFSILTLSLFAVCLRASGQPAEERSLNGPYDCSLTVWAVDEYGSPFPFVVRRFELKHGLPKGNQSLRFKGGTATKVGCTVHRLEIREINARQKECTREFKGEVVVSGRHTAVTVVGSSKCDDFDGLGVPLDVHLVRYRSDRGPYRVRIYYLYGTHSQESVVGPDGVAHFAELQDGRALLMAFDRNGLVATSPLEIRRGVKGVRMRRDIEVPGL